MKDVFVTGASGFIGKHLCRRLLDNGMSVRACVRTAEAAAVLPDGAEPFVVGNIESISNLGDVIDNVDAVVHLAGRAHIIHEKDSHPLSNYRRVNVKGTRNVLDACILSSARRLVYISSIGVVGRGSSRPYRETDPCRPEDPYAQSKYEAEQIVQAANEQASLETVVLRPPLVYGPGVAANFLRIMRLVRKGLPLPLGLVKNSRSMLFVGNLVDAIVVCLTHPQAKGEVFHVADRHPIATSALIEMLAENFGKRSPMWPIPLPLLQLAGMCLGKNVDVERLVRSMTVSTEKIEQMLGWKPVITTEEGIRYTVEAFLAENLLPKRELAQNRRAA